MRERLRVATLDTLETLDTFFEEKKHSFVVFILCAAPRLISVSDGSKSPLHSEDVAMPALDHLKMMPEQQRAEMEFSWELYLQEMNAHPVPHLAFDHVRSRGFCIRKCFAKEKAGVMP